MLFLVTNDDGYLAPGIRALARAVEPLGEVVIVAPDREQSATSHSLTLHHPLRARRMEERMWQIDGTPTDCVMLAVNALLDRKPFDGETPPLACLCVRDLERALVLAAQPGERGRITPAGFAAPLRGDLRSRGEAGGDGQRRAIEEIAPRDRGHAGCSL